MKRHATLAGLVFLAFSSLAGPQAAHALDAPHNTLECNTCHISHSGASGSGEFLTKDPAGINSLCQSCHYAGGPAIEVDTHKSTTAAGQDFDFSLTCNNCHDPHTQLQTYGKFVKTSVVTPNSGTKAVVLNAATGPKSFADGDATYDGICEVCHTLTSHHRNDGTGPLQSHNDGANCSTCHKHNDTSADNLGFRHSGGACTDCHGSAANQRRAVAADFAATRKSGHVKRDLTAKPLNKYDCVVCHLEGSADGSINSTYHNTDLAVNLRDLDNAANVSWKWQDTDAITNTPNTASCSTPNQRTQSTMFCLQCHDGDGITDVAFISSVNTNDAAVSRLTTDPFGAGSNLGTLPPNVSQQFTPTNFATHSISCRPSAGGTCAAECPAGQHNDQSTGVCVNDNTCPGSCVNAEVCDDSHGVVVCQCPPNYAGGSCGQCAPGYTGYPTCSLVACLSTGDPCANGHGSCASTTGSPAFEQLALSEAGSTGWTSATIGGSNGGTIKHNNGGTTVLTLASFSTQGASLTYTVWVAATRTNIAGKGKSPTLNLAVGVDGGNVGTLGLASDDTFQWTPVGTVVLNAATHAATFSCTADAGWSCAVDGIFLTTDAAADPNTDIPGLLPYGTANWDAASLDVYTPPVPPGLSCQCGTGYTGVNCESCAAGYHIENGACVADGAGVCASVTCSSLGACYVDSNNTAVCDCSGTYYGLSPTTCAQCDAPAGGWSSGQKAPSFPGIRTTTWVNSWTENSTTECFDCHAPGGTYGGSKYSSGNLHGSANTAFLLDDHAGAGATIVSTSNGISSTVVCLKCHSVAHYLDGTADSRYTAHNRTGDHQDEANNWLGIATGGDTGIGCFNCHGGGSRGAIHGVNTTIVDDNGLPPLNSILFFNGAALDGWDNVNGSVTCSVKQSTDTWNLGCTAHTSRSYTRTY